LSFISDTLYKLVNMGIIIGIIVAVVIFIFIVGRINSGNRGTVNISNEQLELLRGPYEDLTKEQKWSIYNLYGGFAQLCRGSVTKYAQVLGQMRLQAKILDIDPQDADNYFRTKGIEVGMNEIKKIKDRAVLDSMLITSFAMVGMASGKINGMDSQYVAQELFIRQFGQFGYSESDIETTIMKMSALMNQFG